MEKSIKREMQVRSDPPTDKPMICDDDHDISNLAIHFARQGIINYRTSYDADLINRNLQSTAFYHVIKDLDFGDKPYSKLTYLRGKLLNNLYVDQPYDTIKCFLRLMVCNGTPKDIQTKICPECREMTEYFIFNGFMLVQRWCWCDLKILGTTPEQMDMDPYPRMGIDVTYDELCKILQKNNMEHFNRMLNLDKDVASGSDKSELGSGFVAQSKSKFKAQALLNHDHSHTVKIGMDDNLSNFIQSLSNQVPQAISQTKEYLSTACKLFLILRNLDDMTSISITFIDLLLTWNVPMKIASAAWTWISEHCSCLFGSKFKAQIATPINTKALTMLITCICGLLGANKLPCKSMITTVLKSLGDVGRATQGYRVLSECFSPIFNRVYKTVYQFIFGVPPEMTDLESMLTDIRLWFLDVERLTPLSKQDSIPTDYKTIRDVERVYNKGLMFLRQIDMLKLSPPDKEPFLKYWMLMQKIYDRAIAQGVRKSEPRTEPVIIHLFGSSGVGKSGLVYLLAQDICAQEGLASETMDETYFRNVEQEFWDGYHGQMVCVYDDFGQMKDVQGSPNPEFMEIVRCRNIAPWPLHMAHLEDKARTRFTSRAIILTSNESHYLTPSLTCPEAFDRRLDLSAKVKIKKEFLIPGTERLDPEKVSKPLDESVYLFCLHENKRPLLDSKGKEIWLDYDKFSKMCVSKYNKMYYSSKRRLECLQQRSHDLKSEKPQRAERSQMKAQINLDEITVDRCIQATVWLNARDPPNPFNKSALVDDKIITEAQNKELLELAVKSEDYYDFMVAASEYCIAKEIDLLRVITPEEASVDYRALHQSIYDRKLTENKRVGPLRNYVDYMFERLKLTIIDAFHRIKDTVAKNYITFGSIAVGIVALYGLKSFFAPPEPKKSAVSKPMRQPTPSRREQRSSSVPPRGHSDIVPIPESRELEKRRPKRIVAEMDKDKCTAESRIEEKRKPRRAVAEFWFSGPKCTCDVDALARVCLDAVMAAIPDFVISDDNCKDNGTLCWSCFTFKQHCERAIMPVLEANYQMRCSMGRHDMISLCLAVEDALAEIIADEIAKKELPYLKAEMALDQNSQELRYGPIVNNLYRIRTIEETPYGPVWKDRVNVLFVRGRIILTVRHVVNFLNEECSLVNPFNIDGLNFKKSDCRFIPLTTSRNEDLDAVLIELPRSINGHRDIIKQFTLQEDLCKFSEIPGNLPHLRYLGKPGGNRLLSYNDYSLTSITTLDSMEYTLDDMDGTARTLQLRQGYRYYAETSGGDCGAPLLASAPSLSRKILGIHVAGYKGEAWAVHITQNMIDRALRSISFEAQIKLDLPYTGEHVVPEGNFMPIGKYPNVLPRPTKTELRPSPIYNLVKEPFKQPAVLKPITIDGERVDPLMTGLKKCGVVTPTIDIMTLRRCRIALTSFLKKNRSKSFKGILTVSESIKGLPGDDFITPVKRRSSPGIPWCFQAGGTAGKRKWLGDGEDYILDHPDLMNALQKRYELACKGERMETIWADTLKDELRPIEKVKAGKTRVFSAGPMDFVIFMRQYYLPFFAHMMRNRIHNFCGVGINATGVDWEVLTKKLRSKGSKVAAGDFRNFDGTELAEILWACCDIICDVEDDPEDPDNDLNRKIRKVIFCEIVNSIHLHGNNIYGWNHSLTSGNPGTAVINTLYNVLSMMYVFCKTTDYSPSYFFDHVYMVAYGDDNIINMSDFIAPIFNQVTITRGYADIGMEYTDEDKTGNIVPFRSLSEISFLKRKFRYDTDLCRHVAPLDLDTILEMTMWVRGDLDHNARCAINIEHAYRELAMHGRDVFEHWSVILDKLAHTHLTNPPILYDYLDYVGQEFEW